jgi:hypothetical protein
MKEESPPLLRLRPLNDEIPVQTVDVSRPTTVETIKHPFAIDLCPTSSFNIKLNGCAACSLLQFVNPWPVCAFWLNAPGQLLMSGDACFFLRPARIIETL